MQAANHAYWTLAGGKIRAGEVENCARAEKRAGVKNRLPNFDMLSSAAHFNYELIQN
jgi:hypothetical protein